MGNAAVPAVPILGKIVDVVLGTTVMGTVGSLLGLLMGNEAMPIAIGIGVVMGAVIGLFRGRGFLISILVGTFAGGALAWALAGFDKMLFGAGAGAAMGGFLGVHSSMLMDLWAERKQARRSDSAS